MRGARLSLRERRQLGLGAIEIGVVGDQHVGTVLRDDVPEALRGLDVGLEPEAVGPLGRDVGGPVRRPVERGPAPRDGGMWRAAVLDRDHRRDRAQRVAGREIHRHRGVTERQTLTVGRHHVARRFRPRPGGVGEQLPVRRRHHDSRPETLLQQPRAADVIAMSVAHDDVLDGRRIESELLQAVDDLVFNRIIENGVDQDEPGGGLHGPDGVFDLTEEVEVVEDLRRLGVPLRTIGRTGRLRSGGLSGREPERQRCTHG